MTPSKVIAAVRMMRVHFTNEVCAKIKESSVPLEYELLSTLNMFQNNSHQGTILLNAYIMFTKYLHNRLLPFSNGYRLVPFINNHFE